MTEENKAHHPLPTPEILKAAGQKNFPELVRLRRHFHENPELGFGEFRTSAHIADLMEGLGLEVRRSVAQTGVVALLRGGKPGKTVAIRADIDALPVQVLNDVPYKS